MKSAFFSILALAALGAGSVYAREAPAPCNGYFSDAQRTTYTITDWVPTGVDPAEVSPVQDASGNNLTCDVALYNLIKGGDLHVGLGHKQLDLTVVMKVYLHREEEEILLPYLKNAPNPGKFKIASHYGKDVDGLEVYFVKVSKK